MNFKAINCEDIPAMGNRDNPTVKLIMDFLESGADAAEVTDSPYGVASTVGSVSSACRRAKLPAKAIQRQKRVFLIRTDRGVKI